MRSIEELKEKQKEYQKVYKQLERTEDTCDFNIFDIKEESVIAGHWVDFIDDLLDYNYINFMEENGYGEDDIENTFTFDDPEVQKAIFITEEQAIQLLERKKEFCEKHPYGVTNHIIVGGIFLERLEVDILKWFLEIE